MKTPVFDPATVNLSAEAPLLNRAEMKKPGFLFRPGAMEEDIISSARCLIQNPAGML